MSYGRADVVIGIPTYDGSLVGDMENDLNRLMNYTTKKGITCVRVKAKGSSIAQNRNHLVKVARDCSAAWLLQIDSDMRFPEDALTRLLDASGWPGKVEKKVLSGLYVGKTPPYVPICSRINGEGTYDPIDEWPDDGWLEADGVGGGFLLTHMTVFDTIERPYFCFAPLRDGDDALIGEDYYFCRKLREKDHTIHVYTGIILGHVGPYMFSVLDSMEAGWRKNGPAEDNPDGTVPPECEGPGDRREGDGGDDRELPPSGSEQDSQ